MVSTMVKSAAKGAMKTAKNALSASARKKKKTEEIFLKLSWT